MSERPFLVRVLIFIAKAVYGLFAIIGAVTVFSFYSQPAPNAGKDRMSDGTVLSDAGVIGTQPMVTGWKTGQIQIFCNSAGLAVGVGPEFAVALNGHTATRSREARYFVHANGSRKTITRGEMPEMVQAGIISSGVDPLLGNRPLVNGLAVAQRLCRF